MQMVDGKVQSSLELPFERKAPWAMKYLLQPCVIAAYPNPDIKSKPLILCMLIKQRCVVKNSAFWAAQLWFS